MFSTLSIRARITLGSVTAATILLLLAFVVMRVAVQVNTLPRDATKAISQRDLDNTTFTLHDDDARSYVIVGRTVQTTEGTWVLWSARSTSASEIALHGLDRVLVVAGGMLLLGLGLASWILVCVALQPVTAMRRKAEEFIPITFDRFSRPDISRTESTGGSGLGLALVHATASAAGGSAALKNTGDGLRVIVWLPKM